MAVVINSFEAVAESPEQRSQRQDNNPAETDHKPATPEAQDLAKVLQVLAIQDIRSWAH
jgi:hypothetical protein